MKPWHLIAITLSITAGACASSETANSTASGGNTGSGGSGGDSPNSASGSTVATSSSTGAGGFGPTVTYSGMISHAISMSGLADADVCVIEPDVGCVKTDAVGDYTFPDIPANTRVRVRVALDTFFPVEGLIDVGDMDGTQNAVLLPTVIATLALSGIGVVFDDSKPAISVGVLDSAGNGLPGYQVLLSPGGGEGPFYLEGVNISPTAIATTDVGQAIFVNLDPGDYSVGVVGPGTCTPFVQAPLNSHPAPLQNAALFAAFFACE